MKAIKSMEKNLRKLWIQAANAREVDKKIFLDNYWKEFRRYRKARKFLEALNENELESIQFAG